MSISASPPPVVSLTRIHELEDQLDADIAKVRAEIENLRKEHSRFSAALLSSSRVQEHIKKRQTAASSAENTDLEQSPLHQSANSQASHNETNIHRLAFGVTSFPFTDPAPENKGQPPLLGVRFDIPTRDGRFGKQPYYVFLKRAQDKSNVTNDPDTGGGTSHDRVLQIHHHTIPSHINIDDLAARYLPQLSLDSANPDFISLDEDDNENRAEHTSSSRENSSFDDSGIDIGITNAQSSGDMDSLSQSRNSPSQSLHLFTSHLRATLMSFHLRMDVTNYLAERLNIRPSGAIPQPQNVETEGLYAVQSLSAPDPDARHVRIVWADGSLGRLRINDEGLVERAVVFGGEHNARLHEAERALTFDEQGENVKIQDLIERLKVCHERKYWTN